MCGRRAFQSEPVSVAGKGAHVMEAAALEELVDDADAGAGEAGAQHLHNAVAALPTAQRRNNSPQSSVRSF
jgi:hypothetical protein